MIFTVGDRILARHGAPNRNRSTGQRGDCGLAMALAAGAILAMLADTMLPEAFEEAGTYTGLPTVLGFARAFILEKLGWSGTLLAPAASNNRLPPQEERCERTSGCDGPFSLPW